MQSLILGVHHITLCPGRAQEDVDFFTEVLGPRLIKQTVLMDGSIPIYHLYYGNGDADVGSIATTFPYPVRLLAVRIVLPETRRKTSCFFAALAVVAHDRRFRRIRTSQRPAGARRVDRLVKRREDPRFSKLRAYAVPVEIRA